MGNRSKKSQCIQDNTGYIRGESEHSNLPSVVWTFFLLVLVPGMTTIGYVQPERLMQHREPFVANRVFCDTDEVFHDLSQ